MEYKGIEYQVLQTPNPPGWKWIVFLDANRTRTGYSRTRAHAILDARGRNRPSSERLKQRDVLNRGECGHIKQRIDLYCADDDTAKERAISLQEGNAIELWRSDRIIATSEPDLER
jgi:hypothetical protein